MLTHTPRFWDLNSDPAACMAGRCFIYWAKPTLQFPVFGLDQPSKSCPLFASASCLEQPLLGGWVTLSPPDNTTNYSVLVWVCDSFVPCVLSVWKDCPGADDSSTSFIHHWSTPWCGLAAAAVCHGWKMKNLFGFCLALCCKNLVLVVVAARRG